MTVSGALARPMLAGIFIYGGVDALRDPESKVKAADDVAPMIAEALRLPTTDTVALVRINGGVQVLAGTMLALGKARRVSALVLAASLLPTTYAGHRFWEEMDEEQRAQQRVQFLKNVAILGGLVLAAGDTGGRPSVPWQARRATRHAIEATVAAGVATEEAAKQVIGSSKNATKRVGRSAKGSAESVKGAAGGVAATAAGHASEVAKHATQIAHAATTSDLGSDLSKRARKAAAKARKADLAEEFRKLTQAAKESDLTGRAMKAAKQAAKKAKKGDLTGRALKAAKKAAKKAEAQRATLAKGATRASRRTSKKIRKAQVVPHAAASAGKVQQAASEAMGRVREVAGDATWNGAVERVGEGASSIMERTRGALPVG